MHKIIWYVMDHGRKLLEDSQSNQTGTPSQASTTTARSQIGVANPSACGT